MPPVSCAVMRSIIARPGSVLPAISTRAVNSAIDPATEPNTHAANLSGLRNIRTPAESDVDLEALVLDGR